MSDSNLTLSDIQSALAEGEEVIDDGAIDLTSLDGDGDNTPVIGDEEKERNKDDDGEDEEKENKLDTSDLDDKDENSYLEVPRRQAILKKFPEIFKTFPGMEKALFRENQYAELFGTIGNAREQVNELKEFKKLESNVMNGSIEELLTQVKQQNPKSFDAIVNGLLQTLMKVDQKSYGDLVNFVVASTLTTAFNQGKEAGDDDGKQLSIAATLINKWIFGRTALVDPRIFKAGNNNNNDNAKSPEQVKFENEKVQFEQRQLRIAIDEVQTKVTNLITAWITKNIDPKNQMTDYIREKAVSDAVTKTENSIRNDARFQQNLSLLWKEAIKNSLDENSKTKIKSSLISKAKTVLPEVVNSVKANALKGFATRATSASRSNDDRPIENRRPATSNNSSRERDPKKIPRNMSTRDYLNQD